MTNYAGMDPRSALAAWYAQRNEADPNTLDMTDLARQNPAAWQLLKTGQNIQGDSHNRQIFNPNTGQWDTQEKHGWFSHPESWIQLGLGAGMGGLGLADALGNAAGSAASAAGSAGGATSEALGVGGAAIPTTMGLASGDGVGVNVGQPSMNDISGLVAGPTGYGGAGGDAGKAAGSLLTGQWSPLLKALAGVGGLIGGKALQDHTQQNAIPPQLQQLLDLSMQRANAQTPLFNAANKGMYDMLPDFAKKG